MEENLALPLDTGLDKEVDQDEDQMYANLLAAAPGEEVSRATPLDEKRQKQHVQRQIPPTMVIEIDKGDANKDFIIEVDNPYPQIGEEIVSKPTTGTVSRSRFYVTCRSTNDYYACLLSTNGVCHLIPAVSSNVQTLICTCGT